MSSSNIFWRDNKLPFIEIRKTIDSSEQYKIHAHENFLSIGAVESGEVLMICNGVNNTVSSGMMVFFNPHEPHSCNPLDGKDRSYWMMYLDIEWCIAIQREMFGDADGFIPLSVSLSKDTEIFEDFCDVCNSLCSSLDFFDGEYELLRFVANIFATYCTGQKLEKVSNIVIKEVADFLVENPFKNISLDELANKFRQNRFHLLRSFKDVYGMPPHSFQMNLRIEKAKEMLRAGAAIVDVAQETGFTDQSHFHRVFKKHTAATPGQYRKT